MFQAQGHIGHRGEELSERFSKHRYDIKNNDFNVIILQNNTKTANARRKHEDKLICQPKAFAPHGMNTEIGDMYNFYQFSNELRHKFRYYVHIT